ncbi:hypothetical protein Q9L58_005235 [Maublancomyces gigas]|uniref:Uncharacterized protein n=1 Tax=Discina gigas TaxID=1032678 RepID=A0ABR3GJ70_9PEZI
MNKRKQISDDPTDSSSATTITVDNTFPLPKTPLARHMYTIEEQRFVWYHRDIKKMSAKMVHKNFYDYFNPEVAVSVDSLTQLAGRIRRTQPREVVSCVSGERWDIAAKPAASEEVSHVFLEYRT